MGKSNFARRYIFLFVILSAAAVGATERPAVALEKVTFKAYIDGRSQLILRSGPDGLGEHQAGVSLIWNHLMWAAPGKEGNSNFPTYVNGKEWQPTWPAGAGPEGRTWFPMAGYSNLISSSLTLAIPQFNSVQPNDYSIHVISGRAIVKIEQYPLNDEWIYPNVTLVIDLDDKNQFGAEWVEFELTYPAMAAIRLR